MTEPTDLDELDGQVLTITKLDTILDDEHDNDLDDCNCDDEDN